MTQILVNGVNIHYEQHAPKSSADKHPILFLHGLGSSTKDWQHQLMAFTDHYPIVLADLRGHGQSDNPDGPWSISGMADDMASLITSIDIGPAHVVGLSMGAQVAMQLALDHPELIVSVTAVNSPADMVPKRLKDKLTVLQRKLLVRVFGMRKVGEVLSTRLFPGDQFVDVRKQFTERWAHNNPAAYQKALNAILKWDITDSLHRINQPILVVAASDDYTPLAWKKRIVDLAPNATLKIVENSRHATPVDQPEVFNKLLHDFLQGQD